MRSRGFIAAVVVSVAMIVLAAGCGPRTPARRWLGREYWANRLQDWQWANGRIECLADGPALPARTAFLLTRQIDKYPGGASLRVRTGMLAPAAGVGWSGFLIGIGNGRLDYRAAALVHHLSGQGGGIMAVFQADGRCAFREHTSETQPRAFDLIPGQQNAEYVPRPRTPKEDIELTLAIARSPRIAGGFDLTLTARQLESGEEISKAVLTGVGEKQILGGIALVSHPGRAVPPQGGGRFWFADLEVTGMKVGSYPQRAWGPVAGTLFSLNGSVLRLNAQFMPLGPSARDAPVEYTAARLDYLPGRGEQREWIHGPVSKIETPSQTALFRIADWSSRQSHEYRVVPLRPNGSDAPKKLWYHGRIPEDPLEKDPLVIAAFTGCCFMGRCPDQPARPGPAETFYGRYSPEMIWIPHVPMLKALWRHKPDLMFFTGDQIYQGVPTGAEGPPFPADDFLYKWLHWIASFRELTGDVPTIVQTDDHDVYQGNIWGWSGRKNTTGDNADGGYIYSPEFVNMVQRCMCAHNADPYDPTPVLQDISVYYTAFKYGGVSFAVLEDRKFKTPRSVPPETGELLGPRQEKFLAEWARDWDGVVAKVVVTQTTYASTNTDEAGQIARNVDSNGFPKPARDRAVGLIRDAGAICIAGDQHLATTVVQGLDKHDDGFVQFMVPAVGSTFQRWWDPAEPGANREPGAPPQTGNFIDPFGNRFRMLAAASPSILRRRARGPIIRDPGLTKTGYGLIRVHKKDRQFILECWPGAADPAGGEQFPGWPIRVPFPKSRYGPKE